MPRSVAVAIGVGRAAGYAELLGAPTGAEAFAAWAAKAGFDEVYRFIDSDGARVTITPIFEAIEALVRQRETEKLYIYFAGHGVSHGYDYDNWILSPGTTNPGMVINVGQSVHLARQSQIPHIAIFADTCRTIVTNHQLGLVNSTPPIFPDLGVAQHPGMVDVFYGTRTASAALEVAEDSGRSEAHGIFTTILLDALTGRNPGADYWDADTGRTVILASTLKLYLQERLAEVTSELPSSRPQAPDCRTDSYLPTTIAVVAAPQKLQLSIEARLADGTLATDATITIFRERNQPRREFYISHRVNSPRFSKELVAGCYYRVEVTLADHRQSPEPPQPIIWLTKAQPIPVILHPVGHPAAQLAPPPPPPSLRTTYLIDRQGRVCATAPSHGTFTVVTEDILTGQVASNLQMLQEGEHPRPVASLAANVAAETAVDEIAHRDARLWSTAAVPRQGAALLVGGAPVIQAVPPGWHPLPPDEDGPRGAVLYDAGSRSAIVQVEGERYAALALFEGFAGIAQIGQGAIDHVSYLPLGGLLHAKRTGPGALDRAWRSLGLLEAAARRGRFQIAIDDRLGITQTYNPLLGIFAAYAYHRLGAIDMLGDLVRRFLEGGQPIPFDVALLAGVDRRALGHPIVPSYPMLTSGWQYLGADDEIHPALAAFRHDMIPGLWATAHGTGGQALAAAVAAGELS